MSYELQCQGRAYRDGRWLPWHVISATVYENRKKCPRDGYQVRIGMLLRPSTINEFAQPLHAVRVHLRPLRLGEPD
jgi:hypothetical protein